MVQFATLTDLFRQVVESYANPRAFNAKNGEGWKPLSTQQFKEAVVTTALALKQRG